MHIYAEQIAFDYACMCMWLRTSMPCCQLVNTYAWACEYVHLCHAFSYANDSLVVSGPLKWLIQQNIPFNRLCTFLLCSQLITMYACACDYAHLIYVVATFLLRSSQLCVHEHVTPHIYAMRSACDYACMCMWLCTSMLCSQLVTMYARAWAMHLYAMQSSCDYACLCVWLCTSMPCSQS